MIPNDLSSAQFEFLIRDIKGHKTALRAIKEMIRLNLIQLEIDGKNERNSIIKYLDFDSKPCYSEDISLIMCEISNYHKKQLNKESPLLPKLTPLFLLDLLNKTFENSWRKYNKQLVIDPLIQKGYLKRSLGVILVKTEKARLLKRSWNTLLERKNDQWLNSSEFEKYKQYLHINPLFETEGMKQIDLLIKVQNRLPFWEALFSSHNPQNPNLFGHG